jgi:hypothetical protein
MKRLEIEKLLGVNIERLSVILANSGQQLPDKLCDICEYSFCEESICWIEYLKENLEE